jgi:hypothetical protein
LQEQKRWVGSMNKSAFQVVELTLDTDDNVSSRSLCMSNTQRCSRYHRELRKAVHPVWL